MRLVMSKVPILFIIKKSAIQKRKGEVKHVDSCTKEREIMRYSYTLKKRNPHTETSDWLVGWLIRIH